MANKPAPKTKLLSDRDGIIHAKLEEIKQYWKEKNMAFVPSSDSEWIQNLLYNYATYLEEEQPAEFNPRDMFDRRK